MRADCRPHGQAEAEEAFAFAATAPFSFMAGTVLPMIVMPNFTADARFGMLHFTAMHAIIDANLLI